MEVNSWHLFNWGVKGQGHTEMEGWDLVAIARGSIANAKEKGDTPARRCVIGGTEMICLYLSGSWQWDWDTVFGSFLTYLSQCSFYVGLQRESAIQCNQAKTGSFMDLAWCTILRNPLILSNEERFWINPVWSALTSVGITFSSQIAIILVNVLYLEDKSEIGLYDPHNLGSFYDTMMRACSKVLGSWLVSIEWLNISKRGSSNLLANVLKKSIEKPSGPGALPPGGRARASSTSYLVF